MPASWFLNLFGIAVPLVIFFFLGSMARNVIGGRIIDLVDRIFLRFPIVSSIYSAIKQMIDAFKNLGGQNNFQRVVYIDYPSPVPPRGPSSPANTTTRTSASRSRRSFCPPHRIP
ncbi:MAG: DUF502 domain-containing protein [Verrucomicrobiales bacterium]